MPILPSLAQEEFSLSHHGTVTIRSFLNAVHSLIMKARMCPQAKSNFSSGLLQSSGGDAASILLVSALSSIHAEWLNKETR